VLRTLPAYAVVDLRADWKLASALTVFGRVENVGNKYYQTAYGYNSLRRTAYLGLRGNF
jgi:vitamin B12 transporter